MRLKLGDIRTGEQMANDSYIQKAHILEEKRFFPQGQDHFVANTFGNNKFRPNEHT